MKKLSLLFVVLLLNGCITFALVEPGKIDAGGNYNVTTSTTWSKVEAEHNQILTVDGLGLQSVYISNGISEGDRLFGGSTAEAQPPYKPDMALPEIQDFILNSLVAAGMEKVEFTEIKLENFGDWPGLRMEFSMYTKNGLQKRGIIVAAQNSGKLFSIAYLAPTLHFYDKSKDDVEEIIRSIPRLIEKAKRVCQIRLEGFLLST